MKSTYLCLEFILCFWDNPNIRKLRSCGSNGSRRKSKREEALKWNKWMYSLLLKLVVKMINQWNKNDLLLCQLQCLHIIQHIHYSPHLCLFRLHHEYNSSSPSSSESKILMPWYFKIMDFSCSQPSSSSTNFPFYLFLINIRDYLQHEDIIKTNIYIWYEFVTIPLTLYASQSHADTYIFILSINVKWIFASICLYVCLRVL